MHFVSLSTQQYFFAVSIFYGIVSFFFIFFFYFRFVFRLFIRFAVLCIYNVFRQLITLIQRFSSDSLALDEIQSRVGIFLLLLFVLVAALKLKQKRTK